MGIENLLDVEPQELTFRFELRREASCTIRLSNNSRERVAFKVMTTNPNKYTVRPNMGILSPRSRCDVKVTMAAPREAPPDMQCNDKFLIKSVVASPWDTVETSQRLFSGRQYMDGDCRLRVVYVLPSHQQSSNFERSAAEGSSRHGSLVRQRSVSETQRQDRNGRQGGNLFAKGIIVAFLSLIFWYLIRKMLPLVWSLIFMMVTFVIRMVNRQVSDHIEDWIEKIVFYICIHLFSFLFRRK